MECFMFNVDGYLQSKSISKELEKSKDDLPSVEERWENHTYDLQGNDKKVLSILLENQSIIDKMATSPSEIDKFSIDLVVGMYKPFIQLGICHLIPMLGPTLLYEEYFKAHTRKMKPVWRFEAQPPARMSNEEINQYTVSKLKPELFTDLFNEAFIDMKTNSSVDRNEHTTDYPSSLEVFLKDLQEMDKKKPEWIIANKDVAESLVASKIDSRIPEKVGTFKDLAVIVNPNLEENQILLGRKDCYIHAGYVPLTITPTVLDPDTFEARRGFYIRYDKKLLTSKGLYLLTFKKQITDVK